MKCQYVAGFMFSPDLSRVALIRRQKPEWQKGLYDLVGGEVKSDEAPMTTQSREFKDQTGVDHYSWIKFAEVERAGVNTIYYWAIVGATSFKDLIKDKLWTFRCWDVVNQSTAPNVLWLLYLCLDNINLNDSIYTKVTYFKETDSLED